MQGPEGICENSPNSMINQPFIPCVAYSHLAEQDIGKPGAHPSNVMPVEEVAREIAQLATIIPQWLRGERLGTSKCTDASTKILQIFSLIAILWMMCSERRHCDQEAFSMRAWE
jgi:hypothetical protein